MGFEYSFQPGRYQARPVISTPNRGLTEGCFPVSPAGTSDLIAAGAELPDQLLPEPKIPRTATSPSIPGAGPMTLPSGPGQPADSAMESAQARLAAAKCEIEVIRGEREHAESITIGKLDHAGDVGIHNKSR
jgi:hypothetical protein